MFQLLPQMLRKDNKWSFEKNGKKIKTTGFLRRRNFVKKAFKKWKRFFSPKSTPSSS